MAINSIRDPDEGHTAQRCVVYTRVARADSGEPDRMAAQEEICREWAAEQGWAVVGVYGDIASGTSLDARQGLTALREAAQAGDLDIVLVPSLDRLSRSFSHYQTLYAEWAALGIVLEVVAGNRSEA